MTAPQPAQAGTRPSVVIVPLDGSAPARSALPVAHTLARALGATLHVVHVSEPALPAAEAHRRLDAPGIDVVHTTGGDPASAILVAARRGATIVMASHCGHPRDSGLGRVAERVLQETTAPVVFVPPSRGEVPWEPRTLLLPLDGAPGSAQAVRHAQRLARAWNASLTLLHVAGTPRAPERGSFGMPVYADQPQHEWPAWRAEFAERSACGCAEPGAMQVHVACGPPGGATVRAADESGADLVVVAWHGVLGDGHADTLQTVLAGASCPVMVVRAA